MVSNGWLRVWGTILILLFSAINSGAWASDPKFDLKAVETTINSGHFVQGLAMAESIVQQAEAQHDSLTLATALLRVSDAHYYLGQREATLGPIQRALALYQGLNDFAGIGRSYYSLAYYYERNDPQQMIALLEKGASFAEQADDQRLIMNIANATGVAFWNQGQYPSAVRAFEKSMTLARQIQDTQALASASQNVGLIYLNQGQPREALRYFKTAQEAFSQGESNHNLAVVLGNSGNAYLDLHDYEKAMVCYREAVIIHRENGYLRGEAINLDNQAKIYRILQEWDQAREILLAGITIYQQLGDTRNLVLGYSSLGNLAMEIDDLPTAANYFDQALALGRDYGDPYLLAGLEISLGQLARRQGHPNQAQRWLETALTHSRQVNDQTTGGIALANQAELAADDQQFPRAVELLSQAIKIHEKAGIKTRTYLWQMWLAKFLAATGDQAGARTHFDESLQLVDQLEAGIGSDRFRMGFFREVAGIYHHYSAWLAARGEPLAGMQVLDRGRARVLALRLQRFSTAPATGENDFWQGKELLPGALQLSYSVQNDTLLVFSLGDGKAECRIVAGARDLLQRARMYGELISTSPDGFVAQAAGRNLFQELMEPELARCPSHRLIINPDGVLWTFPFSTLITSPNHYLAQEATISLLPSWAIGLKLASRAGCLNHQALVIANSRFEGDSTARPELVDLRNTLAEGRAVASHFLDPVLLLNTTESRFKNESRQPFGVLHFATHCLTDPHDPLLSGIVMTPSDGDDGLLQAREIHDQVLDCNLAVVSGCHSGSGRIVTGEGLLGITHGLLSAGCRSAVLSRWEVDDRATAFFMGAFYAALEKAPPSKALVIAQTKTRATRQWSSPRFWAAFYLAGNGDVVIETAGRGIRSRLPIIGWLGLAALVLLGGWRLERTFHQPPSP